MTNAEYTAKQDKLRNAYFHLKDYLSENYETLPVNELDNLIHNLEQIIPIYEGF